MTRTLHCLLPALAIASAAVATGAQAAADDSANTRRIGPMSRLPANDKSEKEQLDRFFEGWGNAWKAHDLDTVAGMIDFPVLVMTDDSHGDYSQAEMEEAPWIAMMKPLLAMRPEPGTERGHPEKKWSHRVTCFLLSDDLASCDGEASGDSAGSPLRVEFVVSRTPDGWKVKAMTQAGWGNGSTASNE